MEITTQIVTYKQIKEGYIVEQDDAGIAAINLTTARIKTFMSNPFLKDDNLCMLILMRVDGVVRGVKTLFPTKTKAGNEIIDSLGASAMNVQEEYQKYGLGIELVTYPIYNYKDRMLVYAGFSSNSLPINRKMRFSIFEMPKLMQPLGPRMALEQKGLNGVKLDIVSFFSSCVLKPYIFFVKLFASRLTRTYRVEKMTTVPAWVDDMVLNDGHKYTELHNQAWFQWNVDNTFMSDPREHQDFYAIFKNRQPVGFYMTKDRVRQTNNVANTPYVFRSIVEWGSSDENLLGECDIYRLAMCHVPKDVGILQVASVNNNVLKKLKKLCFFHHGFAYIGCRDLTKQYKDSTDMNLWRVRVGYADVILGI